MEKNAAASVLESYHLQVSSTSSVSEAIRFPSRSNLALLLCMMMSGVLFITPRTLLFN